MATAVDIAEADQMARHGLTKPFKHITFNFELIQDTSTAPSTVVDRRRAIA